MLFRLVNFNLFEVGYCDGGQSSSRDHQTCSFEPRYGNEIEIKALDAEFQ